MENSHFIREKKEKAFASLFSGKKCIFITTKNISYIRNTQEIKLIGSSASSLEIIGSDQKSYAKRLLSVYSKILFTNFRKYDIVFVGFSPQLILPVFSFKFRNNTVYEDFFISMHDTLVSDRKKVSSSSGLAKLLKKLDEITLRKAALIIADTEAHRKYFIEDLSAAPEKTSVLYLEADKKIYYPREKQEDTKFHVLYFGSILPLQGVDVVLKALSLLKENQQIEFEIIGPVNADNQVISDNIKYYSWLSQDELAAHIAESDLCLAGHFNPDIEKANRTIPGKAYIYEAMGKKMVLGDTEANHELFSQADPNIVYTERGNARQLAQVILSEYKKWHIADKL